MSKTLTLSEKVAREAYRDAPESLKRILIENFGENFFSASIMDRVSSFDDILSIAGKSLDQVISSNDTIDEQGYKQGKLIASVYNEGTILDPNNLQQPKFFPWFEITPGSGFGLSYDGCGHWLSYSGVGVRLAFKSRELAIDAGKKFPEVYAKLLIK